MEKSEKNCKPKIVSYYNDYHNINIEYNCELCDNDECPQWKEWHDEQL